VGRRGELVVVVAERANPPPHAMPLCEKQRACACHEPMTRSEYCHGHVHRQGADERNEPTTRPRDRSICQATAMCRARGCAAGPETWRWDFRKACLGSSPLVASRCRAAVTLSYAVIYQRPVTRALCGGGLTLRITGLLADLFRVAGSSIVQPNISATTNILSFCNLMVNIRNELCFQGHL
jgi:hypothetical protein